VGARRARRREQNAGRKRIGREAEREGRRKEKERERESEEVRGVVIDDGKKFRARDRWSYRYSSCLSTARNNVLRCLTFGHSGILEEGAGLLESA